MITKWSSFSKVLVLIPCCYLGRRPLTLVLVCIGGSLGIPGALHDKDAGHKRSNGPKLSGNWIDLLHFFLSRIFHSYSYVTIVFEERQQFRPMPGAWSLWAGKYLYLVNPAVTQNLGLHGLIRRTALSCCLLPGVLMIYSTVYTSMYSTERYRMQRHCSQTKQDKRGKRQRIIFSF